MPEIDMRANATNLAWITSATLVAVLMFSVYAANRAPTLSDEPLQHAQLSSLARYTFADVLGAAGTRSP